MSLAGSRVCEWGDWDAADFEAHVEYCDFNPVKHGFVERAEDWPYSSVHRDMWLGTFAA